MNTFRLNHGRFFITLDWTVRAIALVAGLAITQLQGFGQQLPQVTINPPTANAIEPRSFPDGSYVPGTSSSFEIQLLTSPLSYNLDVLVGFGGTATPPPSTFASYVTPGGCWKVPFFIDYDYTISGAKETSGGHYIVTIPAGQTTRTILITPEGDLECETDETVVCSIIEQPTIYTVTSVHDRTMYIEDEPMLGAGLTPGGGQIYEDGTIGFEVKRSCGWTNYPSETWPARTVTLWLFGAAIPGEDYTVWVNGSQIPLGGPLCLPCFDDSSPCFDLYWGFTIVIPAGVESVTGEIRGVDDFKFEGYESVLLSQYRCWWLASWYFIRDNGNDVANCPPNPIAGKCGKKIVLKWSGNPWYNVNPWSASCFKMFQVLKSTSATGPFTQVATVAPPAPPQPPPSQTVPPPFLTPAQTPTPTNVVIRPPFYIDTSVQAGQTYYYKIVPIDANGNPGTESGVVSATAEETVVSVQATDAEAFYTCSPQNDGTFTITRTTSDGDLMVHFRTSGSGVRSLDGLNGDYALFVGTQLVDGQVVTIPSGNTSVAVTVKVLSSGSAAASKSVLLWLLTGSGMYEVSAGTALCYLKQDCAYSGCLTTTISAGPTNVTVQPGGTAVFSVAAVGTALTYQWYHGPDWSAISGATASSYTINNVQFSHDGPYKVIVSGQCGTAESVAWLAVQPPPTLAPMFDLSRDFSATANPNGPWSYGYAEELDGSFALLTHPDSSLPQFTFWAKNSYEPVAVYHNSSSTTAQVEDDQGVFPPGTTWFGPGNNGNPDNYGVIRFTAPAGGGSYQLRTSVETVFTGPICGDTDFHVLLNGVVLYSSEIAANAGANFETNLTLQADDVIDFAVGRGADEDAFASGLKINASLDPVLGRFDAVQQFSFDSNPSGAWHYGFKATPTGGFTPYNVVDSWGDCNYHLITVWKYETGFGGPISTFGKNTTEVAFNYDCTIANVEPGELFAVPGWDALEPDAFRTLRLVMPSGPAGTYKLTGTVKSLHTDEFASDAAFLIAHNNSLVVTQWLAPDSTLTFQRTLSLAPGHTVDFISGSGTTDQFESGVKYLNLTLDPQRPEYDLNRDFSPATNGGAWTFGSMNALNGILTPFTVSEVINDADSVPMQVWAKTSGQKPAIYHNGSTETAHSDSLQGMYPPGTTWLFAGPSTSQDNYGVVRFTVPAGMSGNYSLRMSAETYLRGESAGDIDLHVVVNQREIWREFMPGNTGNSLSREIPLEAGDRIDFLVGRGADNNLDYSGVKLDVRLYKR